jgi:hypothetical protein
MSGEEPEQGLYDIGTRYRKQNTGNRIRETGYGEPKTEHQIRKTKKKKEN